MNIANMPGMLVAQRRASLGMTQAELASKAGVSSRSVHNLEHGKTWPQPANLLRIEMALGWEPGSLDAIRSGGEPSPLTRAQTDAETTPEGGGFSFYVEEGQDRRQIIGSGNTGLSAIRESMRLIERLPRSVQTIVYSHAREALPDLVDALDEASARRLLSFAFKVLDEQMNGGEPTTVASLNERRSNTTDDDVTPLGYVADSSPDEPEMGDDGYHDGP